MRELLLEPQKHNIQQANSGLGLVAGEQCPAQTNTFPWNLRLWAIGEFGGYPSAAL